MNALHEARKGQNSKRNKQGTSNREAIVWMFIFPLPKSDRFQAFGKGLIFAIIALPLFFPIVGQCVFIVTKSFLTVVIIINHFMFNFLVHVLAMLKFLVCSMYCMFNFVCMYIFCCMGWWLMMNNLLIIIIRIVLIIITVVNNNVILCYDIVVQIINTSFLCCCGAFFSLWKILMSWIRDSVWIYWLKFKHCLIKFQCSHPPWFFNISLHF